MKKVIYIVFMFFVIFSGLGKLNALELCKINDASCNVENATINIKTKEMFDKKLSNLYLKVSNSNGIQNNKEKYKLYKNKLYKIRNKGELYNYFYLNIKGEYEKYFYLLNEDNFILKNNYSNKKKQGYINKANNETIVNYFNKISNINIFINSLEKKSELLNLTNSEKFYLGSFKKQFIDIKKNIKIPKGYKQCFGVNLKPINNTEICKGFFNGFTFKKIASGKIGDKINIGKTLILYDYIILLDNNNTSNNLIEIYLTSKSLASAIIDLVKKINIEGKINEKIIGDKIEMYFDKSGIDKEIYMKLIGNIKGKFNFLDEVQNRTSIVSEKNANLIYNKGEEYIVNEIYNIFIGDYKKDFSKSLEQMYKINKEYKFTYLIPGNINQIRNEKKKLNNLFKDYYNNNLISEIKDAQNAENYKQLMSLYENIDNLEIIENEKDDVKSLKIAKNITKKINILDKMKYGVKIVKGFNTVIDGLAPFTKYKDVKRKMGIVNCYNRNLPNIYYINEKGENIYTNCLKK